MSVELVKWPSGESRRAALALGRRPRVLVVANDASAPVTVDPLEDWVRESTDRSELKARIETLETRAMGDGPTLVDGVLRHGTMYVALGPVEVRLVEALLAGLDQVVSQARLLQHGWPAAEPPRRNVLDVHLVRLRRRLEPLGLSILTVRRRGYVLRVVDNAVVGCGSCRPDLAGQAQIEG